MQATTKTTTTSKTTTTTKATSTSAAKRRPAAGAGEADDEGGGDPHHARTSAPPHTRAGISTKTATTTTATLAALLPLPVSEEQVLAALKGVQLWQISVLTLCLCLLLLGASWVTSKRSPGARQVKAVEVSMCFIELNDVIGDIWTTVQAFSLVPVVATLSALHLSVTLVVNFFLVKSFVSEVKERSLAWFKVAAEHGRSTAWKSTLVVGLFGPRFLKVLGTDLLGLELFSLDLGRVSRALIQFNWGVLFEGVPQSLFAVLQLLLAERHVSFKQKLTVYTSLGLSAFSLLSSAMELAFAEPFEAQEETAALQPSGD